MIFGRHTSTQRTRLGVLIRVGTFSTFRDRTHHNSFVVRYARTFFAPDFTHERVVGHERGTHGVQCLLGLDGEGDVGLVTRPSRNRLRVSVPRPFFGVFTPPRFTNTFSLFSLSFCRASGYISETCSPLYGLLAMVSTSSPVSSGDRWSTIGAPPFSSTRGSGLSPDVSRSTGYSIFLFSDSSQTDSSDSRSRDVHIRSR